MIVNGDVLKQRREQLGISQGQLAQGICHQSLISRLEKDHHITSMTILQNLCARLQINVSSLVTFADQEHMPLNVIRELVEAHQYTRAKVYLQAKRLKKCLPEFALPEYHLLRGRVFLGLDEIPQAMQSLQLAMGDVGRHQPQLMVEIFTEMGAAWLAQNEIINATECLERACTIIHGLSESQTASINMIIVYTYRRQAELYIKVGDAEKAMKRVKEAMALLPSENVYHEMVALQELRIQCADILELTDDKKDAMVLAYAAAKFSRDTRLEDTVKSYQDLL
ncbi:hypothetical protein WS105_0249 [Weissella ceti]|uniref:HTH cro/C1-type domain-containing protein n=2 Tax=Weissella TaxID=46255 RepID=A0A075TY89_9LACO|nr:MULTISPECIES: helix-turn-helix transcriptional regulator [Weissella]AIG65190.1 hypothetical protein WS08_0251 [Weissella tructae]AIM62503.1 hypothetical protein WS74_0251 [Weissella ceti]AIM63839.1 hypothetical protein WS105_0249 [Weissella ceti]ELA07592.1 transcriptional regulator [Weissella ceti NC36]QVV91574.1 helix-turn-helix domain-containing protein [Weissella tructae]